MLDIYGPGGDADAHSHTGFNIFYDAVEANVVEVEQDGKKFLYHEKQKVSILRNGKPLTVLAGDLKADDEIAPPETK
jgi:hypothetical protein